MSQYVLSPDRHGDGSISPCGYIRLLLPICDFLSAKNEVYHVIDKPSLENLKGATVFIQRYAFASEKEAQRYIDQLRLNQCKIIYDIDDDLINIPEDHPEAPILSSRVGIVKLLLQECDFVTVSTEVLKERFSSIRADICVLPNYLSSSAWEAPSQLAQPTDGSLLYFGTSTHDAEAEFMRRVMRSLNARLENNIKCTVIGMTQADISDWAERLQPPSSNYPQFVQFLQNRSPPILGLAPLMGSDFAKAKSDIKLLDYTALGSACVASDVLPYSTSKLSTEVLLLPNDEVVWVDELRGLLTDRPRIQRYREAAINKLTQQRTEARDEWSRFLSLFN